MIFRPYSRAGIVIIATAFLLVQVAAQTPDCQASVSLNSTYPTHAFFIYHYIIVQNLGRCNITRVFVNVTLPPNEQPVAYYNVSALTGELFGLSLPMSNGSVQKGGAIVLTSARVPVVVLGRVECACPTTAIPLAAPYPIPAPSIKIEVLMGSNNWWFGVRVQYDAMQTSKVQLRDSSSATWKIMKPEAWEPLAYTYSTSQALVLPISLMLTSLQGNSVILDNIITSLSHAILDSHVAYQATKRSAIFVDPLHVDPIQLAVHPNSNQHWLALMPYDTRVPIHSITIKGQRSNWMQMESNTPGVFVLSSPSIPLHLPLSLQLTSAENRNITLENVVTSFGRHTINTKVQF